MSGHSYTSRAEKGFIMFSFKDAIKKIQEYYPGFEEKELINIDKWYDKEEDIEYYKTRFPKSYEAIMKNLSTERKFISLYDGQGDEFAVGCYGSMRSWAFKVLGWMDADGFYDDEAEVVAAFSAAFFTASGAFFTISAAAFAVSTTVSPFAMAGEAS